MNSNPIFESNYNDAYKNPEKVFEEALHQKKYF